MNSATTVSACGNEPKHRTSVEEAARQRLQEGCPYAFYFRHVELDFADGVLTLRGRVPTFHLKQILQERLKDVEQVRRIRNQIDVVNSSGLSSVRPR